MSRSTSLFDEVDSQLHARQHDTIAYTLWFFLFLCVIAVGALIYDVVTASTPTQSVTAVVTRAPQYVPGSRGWLIFTPGEVFTDEDNWLRGKTNSADLANQLQVGSRYCLRAGGVRIRWMSRYRNVVTATPGVCP